MIERKSRHGRATSEQTEYLHFIVGGLCLLGGACWVALNLQTFDFRKTPFPEDAKGKNSRKIYGTWQRNYVNLTTLDGTIDSGAVCLDGSPPAYYLDRGSGEGANNWILFLEGGGWCYSEEECLARSFTHLGSSLLMPPTVMMEGLVSSSKLVNPDFYNWNRVVLKYCDGGSFTGDVPDPVKVLASSSQPDLGGTGGSRTLFFRGQRIWMALIKDLLEHGMKLAENAFLTGCSAGGLASIIHCDKFRDMMPTATNAKCLSDAGFFLDVADISGMRTIEAAFKKVVQMQNMIGNLPISCTSRMEPSLCFFPENLIADVKTPLFLLNPAYDSWQFTNVVIPPSADPTGKWSRCRNNFRSCSAAELQSQLKDLGDFRESLLTRLLPILGVEKDGVFIDSCFLHCQQTVDLIWSMGPEINNTSVRQAVGDWYFERTSMKLIDGPSDSDLTCGII